MTTTTASLVALAVYLVGVMVTFGVRTWLHRRTTGSAGFRGISGRMGSGQWWGGVLFVVALLLGGLGPALGASGVLPAADVPLAVFWLGVILAAFGFVGVLLAQTGMGASWRIGVDASEHTTLVTTGLFGWVRNPVFMTMVVALTGLVVMAPTVLSVGALVSLTVAVQLQVRLAEEPYLLSVHGLRYADYAARTGRFVPGVGRLRLPVGAVGAA